MKIIFLLALLELCAAQGYLWNWAWTNPVNMDDGPANEKSAQRDAKHFHARNIHRSSDTASNRTERKFYSVYQKPCENDKSCGKGKYCDKHYGACEQHKPLGVLCRRDGHCQRGLECVFGKCRHRIPEGYLEARCKHDSDCGPNQCCAKQHGERVCKAKLAIGTKCYVPDGGVDYSLNQLCPCESGLVCKYRPRQKRREEEFEWQFWTDYEDMRCVPVL